MSALRSVLSAEDIRHSYGDGDTALVALKGVSLEVRAGEILVLMGPSGSGKTTLIQIMGSLLRPTGGRVRLGGRDVTDLPEAERNRVRLEHFGFIFQTNNLFPTLTATENVMIAFDLLGMERKAARQKARALLASVGLENRQNAFPSQLSGGQKQRVGIARALAGNPHILLADEPTAALDADSGHRVMELMRRMAHEDDRAVVIVTHDPRILDLADRIVRLEDGKIVGTPENGE